MKVLLVEDSKALAERLGEAIRQLAGVNLIGTTDTEGVAIAVAIREDVDVIVLDLHLKKGTGFGVMRALATLQRKPTVIVLTNFGRTIKRPSIGNAFGKFLARNVSAGGQ